MKTNFGSLILSGVFTFTASLALSQEARECHSPSDMGLADKSILEMPMGSELKLTSKRLFTLDEGSRGPLKPDLNIGPNKNLYIKFTLKENSSRNVIIGENQGLRMTSKESFVERGIMTYWGVRFSIDHPKIQFLEISARKTIEKVTFSDISEALSGKVLICLSKQDSKAKNPTADSSGANK